MGTCSRCGRQGHVEYGADGLSYCSSCSFYGLNRPCWRCRMYVPASEIQQYMGQWYCPICIQEERAKHTKFEYKSQKYPMRPLAYPETCERCGRDAEILYIWNNRRLCSSCLDEEQKTWGVVGGGPSGAGQAIPVQPIRIAEKESFIEALIAGFLGLLGLKREKKKTGMIVAEQPYMIVDRAKPMTEGMIIKRDKGEQKMPESEGLMKARKKKKSSKKKSKEKKRAKTKQDVTFPEYKKKKKEKKKKKKDDDDNPFRRFKDKKKK